MSEPLRIKNEAFLIYREVQNCPSTMMIREMVMNSIEASQKDVSGKGLVVIDSTIPEVGCGRKLRIWNNGPGMDEDKIHLATDFSTIIDKIQSLNDNYGVGFKLAGLKANGDGIRFRSCTNKEVSQVILYGDPIRNPGILTYSRYTIEDPTNPGQIARSVHNATDAVIEQETEERYNINNDWTEVVLYGNERGQNTALNPYGDRSTDEYWLGKELYLRFFRIPSNVEIIVKANTTSLMSDQKFIPWSERVDAFRKQETVVLENGIKIHYYDDPRIGLGEHRPSRYPTSTNNAICKHRSLTAIVYKNEMYEVAEGEKWSYMAPLFGVTFGAQDISVIIELPNDYGVRPASNRETLQYTGIKSEKVAVTHFADLVNDNMPEYFRDLIKSYNTSKKTNMDEIEKELQKELDKMLLKKEQPKLSLDGNENADKGDEDGVVRIRTKKPKPPYPPIPNPNPPVKHERIKFDQSGLKPAKRDLNKQRAPSIIVLETEDQVKEKGFWGKAGRFYPNNNLFLNPFYSSWESAIEYLTPLYKSQTDPEGLRDAIYEEVKKMMVYNIGMAVVHSKHKQSCLDTWTDADMEIASSPESLSIVADSWKESISAVQQTLTRAFSPHKKIA